MSFSKILIAALDWEHPEWEGDYYPDDLPDDWRLPYYANEFRAVALPVEKLLGADHHEIESWLSETPDEFRFYLDIQAVDFEIGKHKTRLRLLQPKLAGIVLRPDGIDPRLENIHSLLRELAELAPVFLLIPPGSGLEQDARSRLEGLDIGLCWNPYPANQKAELHDQQPSPWSKATLISMIWIGNTGVLSPRDWRELIEAGLAEKTQGSSAQELVIIDSNSDMAGMQSARVIGDMLLSAQASE